MAPSKSVTSFRRNPSPVRRWRRLTACRVTCSCTLFCPVLASNVVSGFEICNSTDAESPKYCCTPHSQSSTPSKLLTSPQQQLHWLPISERIKYKTACMCYNAITGSAPSYLSELLHLYSPSRCLCSSSDTHMLKIQCCINHKTHGFRTFSDFGPHIWNNLPRDIRHSATLSSFKSQLKTFLFSEYFS